MLLAKVPIVYAVMGVALVSLALLIRQRRLGSAAIAVLIVAFLGAAMWVAFDTIWDDSSDKITQEVNSIVG